MFDMRGASSHLTRIHLAHHKRWAVAPAEILKYTKNERTEMERDNKTIEEVSWKSLCVCFLKFSFEWPLFILFSFGNFFYCYWKLFRQGGGDGVEGGGRQMMEYSRFKERCIEWKPWFVRCSWGKINCGKLVILKDLKGQKEGGVGFGALNPLQITSAY